ncbi:heat shock 70 kDa protein 12A-like [Mytilus edulis]|uniref:heat shock 70 kDa protein 12A-like n=1 Tax=Mytilus edulis TaxID=6550 RepID=UPI0039EE00B1
MDSVYDINITREQNETFGFTVITSEDGGCCIGRITKGGPADRCDGLHIGDQILSVNGIDITSLQHNEIVTLIRDSTETVSVGLMQRGYISNVKCATLKPVILKPEDTLDVQDKGNRTEEINKKQTGSLKVHHHENDGDEKTNGLKLTLAKILKRNKSKEKGGQETLNKKDSQKSGEGDTEKHQNIQKFVTGVPSTTLKSAQSIIIKNTEAADDYYEEYRNNNYLIVAALDFGTTYSGFAFSLIANMNDNPLDIYVNESWNAGGRQLLSLKTPTCLLLDAERNVSGFGYEAENKYTDIVLDKQQADYYYFYRFKMELYNRKNVKADMEIQDVTGKSIPAIEVFSKSIKALADNVFELGVTRGFEFKMHDIKWVLTVPAIWSDAAKEFMKESATKAGIPTHQLYLALEPEAASIFGQYFTSNEVEKSAVGKFIAKTGTKFMVADLGGGTADIIVQEKLENGHLKELHHASGNDCGGTSVDRSYLQIFEEIMGAKTVTKLQKEDPLTFLDLCREFEVLKRTINPSKEDRVNITIPIVGLNEICEKYLKKDFKNALAISPYADKIKVWKDKVRIDACFIKELFTPTINGIIMVIKEILLSVSGVTQILLVGGFSECILVQDAVRRSFEESHNIKVIVPKDAGMSVLKGAVLFGHRPNYIVSRKMRYTYGVFTMEDFNQKIHDKNYMIRVHGRVKCTKLFSPIIKLDDTVKIRQEFIFTLKTNREFQPDLCLPVYCSTKSNPKYTDEEGCYELGKITIDFPNPSKDIRSVQVSFIFGHTELEISAVDQTSGKAISSRLSLI